MKITRIIYITACLLLAGTANLYAQQNTAVKGTITDAKTQEPLAGVNIIVKGTTKGTSSRGDGTFDLRAVSPGTRTLVFSYIGYKRLSRTISVEAGRTAQITVQLESDPVFLAGIHVTALRPDQIAEAQLQKTDIRQANPRDSGELLRNVQGVDAVRRGPVGLDPVIRGFRETEVGTYLDGTRIFPGGPARMDSPLSHLDPSSIKSIQVVKGPYALTWGAGNMSVVKVKTQPLSDLSKPIGGTLSSGFDSNMNALEEAASLHGTSGKLAYSVHGAWRNGNDYTTGNGTTIPAGFLSREIRGKIGYALRPNSHLGLSVGYQNQENIDYPGRLLNADYFNTYNYAVNWKWNPENSTVTAVEANAYMNNVHHGMDNNDKPTAKPDPNRMPPFALDVKVKAHAYVSGGKLAVALNPAPSWKLKVGSDIYSANRDAVRTIKRRDNGMLMFTDLMWPDATITDGGFFAKTTHFFSDELNAAATVRLDLVRASADTASAFFRNNVSTNLDANETNLSGSLTISYVPLENWSFGFGLGSVVRTADATERYSDRTPASKAQTSAEFVGNPALNPERSTQGDLWIDANYSRWSLSVNVFARQMDNYITITPTNLPKRLPLSPNTVYQYVNGSARFWGFDISSSYRLIEQLSFKAGLDYLWGEDRTLDEPALGVSPFSIDTGLRYDSNQKPFFVEGTVHWVTKQDRVASIKGEVPTDGYITADLQAGVTLWRKLSLQGGIKNITDETYTNHLNAKNPYTGQQIPEPGRLFHIDAIFKF